MYTTNVFSGQDFDTKLIMKHDFKCTLDSSKSTGYQFSLNKQNYILSKSPVVKFALDWQKTVFVFAIWPIFFLSLFYYLSVIADMAWNYVFSFPFKSCLACPRNFCCFGVLWKRDLHLDADFYQIESKSHIFEVIFNYREWYFHTKICYFYTKVLFKKHTSSKFGVEITCFGVEISVP